MIRKMYKKGGEGQLTKIILSLLIFGAIMLGLYKIVDEMTSDDYYDIDIDDYSSTFDKTQTLNEELNKSFTTLQSEHPSKTAQFFTGVAAGFNILKSLMFAPFEIAVGFLTDIVKLIGLPDWTVGLGISVIILLIAMAIIGWIKNRDP